MPQFNKTLLPPILEYVYPAFRYENDSGNGIEIELPAMLSITNTIDQVDHVQIRIVSLNTNKNALNPNIFPRSTYFLSMRGAEDLTLRLNTVLPIVGSTKKENIFKNTKEPVYPSYYKMQIRLGIKGNDNYNPTWGQNVSKDWIDRNSENFSEWSNSAVLKTVKRPDFGILTLSNSITNIIKNSVYLWTGFYNTDDGNESLKKYSFRLEDGDKNLLEQSSEIYIGEYEEPHISYQFNEVLIHDREYFLTLFIETTTGYTDSIIYKLKTKFSYVKIYNIFKVTENDDDAHNLVDITAKQVQLIPTVKPTKTWWLSDPKMDELFEENGITHYNIKKGQLETNKDFTIPYNDFSILLATTNFTQKIQRRMLDCFKNNNYLLYFGQTGSFGSDFYLGVYTKNNKYYFILKEIFNISNNESFIQYYEIELKERIVENKEYLFIIKKAKGDTVFEAKKWLDNGTFVLQE